ncbi:MAG TPA: flagellar motor switch protein FliG [Spirochaetia bacterium]|nr:flagellar motor switch protein FliG [Spirochaetia bacterium]
MNEAERGIAAYKATAKKLSQPKKRKAVGHEGNEDEIELKLSSSGRAGVAKPGSSLPAERERSGEGGEHAAEKLLKTDTGGKGYKKVAKFLLLLGKEEAAKILKHFDKEEIEAITREIAGVGRIDKAEADRLLAEFGVAGQKRREFTAGPETAGAILTAAFGNARAKQILRRAVPETREVPFQFLNDIEHEQILLLLKNESSPTVSIVLPYLKPQKASRVLESLAPDMQREVIRRIAKMKKVDPEVIVRIEGVLKERIRTQGRVITEEIDGREALANILKHMQYADEEKILDELATIDPELSENVKDRLFTIELIFKIDDSDLQAIFRDYDDQEIAILLKAKSAKIRDRIMSALSSRRQAMVNEELALLGKMRKSDVDSATKDFVDYIVDLDEQRRITIHWNDQFVE